MNEEEKIKHAIKHTLQNKLKVIIPKTKNKKELEKESVPNVISSVSILHTNKKKMSSKKCLIKHQKQKK